MRNSIFRLLMLLPLWFGLPVTVQAQFRVEISGVGATQVPIAIARFRDEDRTTQSLSAIVRSDLERSGVFRNIEANQVLDEAAQPQMSEWRSRAADALVGGSVTRLADGRFDVRFKLWDVVKGKVLADGSITTLPADLRAAAHRIADVVYEKLTGDKGVFSTRIAYVTRSGRRFSLRVDFADGLGGDSMISSNDPIISPAWSPDGQELAYVSFFEDQKAVIFAQDIATGKRRKIAAFKGSNSAPSWSPDGQSLVVTLSREGGSQLYIVGRNGENPRRITNSPSIDTEGVFSPDGRQIYFVSDRSGGPQIYRVPVAGGTPERVSFTGGYNISPALSPDGRYLAYISRQNGAFKLYVGEVGKPGAPQAITESTDDESPSFAPNGKLIIYATRVNGRDTLMTTTLDGKIKAKLESRFPDVREPAWGPFGR
ncbi:MAG: Tol-Pal system protein TolB [Cytophagales bacterium]|nr:Tol-Pal system protein TolB [Rhizobacter sp.]